MDLKLQDFKTRFAKLQMKRGEAARLNHKEVVDEDRLAKLPKNHVKKKERLEAELHEEELKQRAKMEGKNYDRARMLNVSAADAARWDSKRKRKDPDQGFSNFEDATRRQHNQLVKNIKVDFKEYEKEKQAVGEAAFYGEQNTISIGLHKDSKEAIDKVVDDLQRQTEKRERYSRRRLHDDDADINFINERNMKFNKKLERFYGKYTEEIKQNLERGTAV